MTLRIASFRLRISRFTMLAISLVVLGGLFGATVLFWNLPSVAALKTFRPPAASEVFSDDYVKIGEFFRERRIFVPLRQIPPLLVKAFVAAEDDQFYRHSGISFTGIFRAMVKNFMAGGVKQGGSTITQQVAKELLLKDRTRSLVRKAREAIVAWRMERALSKEEILEIYLNQVYLGNHAYGVQAAAQTFFDKDVADLSLAELAVIAGLTKAPSTDNPRTNLDRARTRQQYVLKRLVEEKYATEEEAARALQEPLNVVQDTNVSLRYAPYFVEYIRQYVTEKYGSDLVLDGGLQIYTTLKANAPAQEALQLGLEEMDRHQGYRGPIRNVPAVEWPTFIKKLSEETDGPILELRKNYRALVTEISDKEGLVSLNLGSQAGVIPIEEMRWARKPNPEKFWENDLIDRPSQALKRGDVVWVRIREEPATEVRTLPTGVRHLELAQDPIVQGAIIALDPRNGAIRSMVGGYDFQKNEFNRAVQAKRQPGSAFKPIIYATALANGYTAGSVVVDAPIDYYDPTTEERWRPKNFGGKFHGDTIFRDCLIESRNIPTIKIVQDIGIDKVIAQARKMGIQSPLANDYSMALGSSVMIPMELVTAYAVFASGGRRVTPIAIKKIVDRDGNVLERNLLDDPSLDLLEQAAVTTQGWLAAQTHEKATEIGKDTKAELPDGYALSPQTAYIMTHLLKEVIHFGTGRRAQSVDRPAAGKTGTTNDNRDAWFVGYTPTMVTGVWIGFDDSGMTLGVNEEGGRAASPIWGDFMKEALKETPTTDFKVPDGIVFAQIDSKTGKLATSKTKSAVFEAFREGAEPKETSEEAQTKKSPQQFFLQE